MKLDAIGIIVSDLKKSLSFYKLLGLKFGEYVDGEDHMEAQTPGGFRIMLDTETLVKQFDPKWKKPAGQSMALAFLCKSPAEVDSTYKEILSKGFKGKREPWDAFWGQRYASVLDPDGHSVDLFAPL